MFFYSHIDTIIVFGVVYPASTFVFFTAFFTHPVIQSPLRLDLNTKLFSASERLRSDFIFLLFLYLKLIFLFSFSHSSVFSFIFRIIFDMSRLLSTYIPTIPRKNIPCVSLSYLNLTRSLAYWSSSSSKIIFLFSSF